MVNDDHYAERGFVIDTDQGMLDFDLLYNFLGETSYWAKNIPPEVLRHSIANSLCFGIYQHSKQVGFARLITDKATFAYLADVFILPEFRGLGLSKWLMQTIMSHQDLQGLRRWLLATRDAHQLYGQYGFSPLSKPGNFMEILTPYKPDDSSS